MCVLSKEKADRFKVWDEISAACERDELIEGKIVARVKGGLSVTIRGGVKAFLPGSQVDLRPVRNLDAFLGQAFKFKVIKFNKKRGNIVLSRRVLLEKERAALKESTLEAPEGRPDRRGHRQEPHRVRRVHRPRRHRRPPPHHRHELGPGQPPVRDVQVGDHVEVKVLKFNADTERVSLGLKQITEDPWSHAEKFVGHRRPRQGGLAQGLRRLHRARGGHRGPGPHLRDVVDPRVKHPSRWSPIGDMVEAVVLDVDVKQNRISARHEAARAEPVRAAHREVPAGYRGQGQGPQHRRLRHLRRDRGRHRRPGPHQRHVVDPARQAPVGAVPEG
jgi:small subunit ribosomal protein S1